MAITVAQVNELRQKTQAGMMDCKKALVESDGDMEKAVEWLRKKGIAKAEEKAGRAANQGIVAIKVAGNVAAMVELLCETDFVARNDQFKAYGAKLADAVLGYEGDGDVSAQLTAQFGEDLKEFIGIIKENMKIRRALRWTTSEGVFGSYIHTATPLAALVELVGEVPAELPNQVAMHITAFNPEYVCPHCVPEARLAKEKEIALATAPQNKPANVIEGIVNGKINKWYSQVCLIKQPWLMDDKTTLEKVAPKAKVARFVRWLVGEELPQA
ncbi:MAG: elongation factor Ts [Victivallales bacterium]|nr:elongation factor Ts [Victivallales bacterium]